MQMSEGYPITHNVSTVRTLSLALIDEMTELAGELGWKPWKPKKSIDPVKVLDEWADLCAFFGSVTAMVMYAAAATPEDLENAYKNKTTITHRRFTGSVIGYARPAQTIEEALAILENWKAENPELAEWLQQKPEPSVLPLYGKWYMTKEYGRVRASGFEGGNWVFWDPDANNGIHYVTVPAGSIKLKPIDPPGLEPVIKQNL